MRPHQRPHLLAHPALTPTPTQPAARVRGSLPAARIRLYKRLGATTGAPLRDDCEVRACLAGGAIDKEVALQLLPAEESLSAPIF